MLHFSIQNFLSDFGCLFCGAGAVIGEVALVAPRIVNDVSYVSRIKHASHLAWQVQYLVRLEGDVLLRAL